MATAARLLAMCLLLTFVNGCKEVLYSQLAEQEANEMVAVLASNGVAVSKTVTDKYWGIEVEGSQIPLAMQLLTREGLPRSRYASLGDMFKREGIVSTPTEERIRFIHGISQELSRTLSMIDGVLAARVHIVLPHNDPLADRAKPSSASVFIRHRADIDLQASLTSIKSLVVRSVEGLSHDSVYVTLFAAEHAPLNRSASGSDAQLGSTSLGASTFGTSTVGTSTFGASTIGMSTIGVVAALLTLTLALALAVVWIGVRYLPAGWWRWRPRVASSSASASAARSDSSQ